MNDYKLMFNINFNYDSYCLHELLYLVLAGATRPCPGHYIKIIKCTVRTKVAMYALQTLFRPPDPWFRVKARSRPDQGDYWEGVPHILFNNICLKIIDHGSRSTRGPGPSRSGLWAQKYERTHTAFIYKIVRFCYNSVYLYNVAKVLLLSTGALKA